MLLKLTTPGGYVSADNIVMIRVEGSKCTVQYSHPNLLTIECSSPDEAVKLADQLARLANGEDK